MSGRRLKAREHTASPANWTFGLAQNLRVNYTYRV